MKRWRRVLVAAWLAFALVAGQQLVVLHALGHATDRINDKDAKTACKVHFACSQLASIAGAKPPPAVPLSLAVHALHGARDVPADVERSFAFLSRGPPIASV